VPVGLCAENDLEARNEYYCPRLLNESWPSWVDVVVVNVLLDRATNIAVAAMLGSAYGPLHGRSGKILQEEAFHRIFGDSWLAKLARMDDRMRGKLQASVDHFWDTAVAWFGPDDDPATTILYSHNILSTTSAQMRQQWLDEVTPLLEKHNLTIPNIELDWSGWNPIYREVP